MGEIRDVTSGRFGLLVNGSWIKSPEIDKLHKAWFKLLARGYTKEEFGEFVTRVENQRSIARGGALSRCLIDACLRYGSLEYTYDGGRVHMAVKGVI